MELDKTSWTILACLQENARASFADIGREVGLSAPAVAERMLNWKKPASFRDTVLKWIMKKQDMR